MPKSQDIIQDVKIKNLDTPLPLGPDGIRHGKLQNGLTYYTRACKKPKQRASLKLVVKVGSILEEEAERGVAHIVEHLAFSASEAYANHEVIAKLEAAGCEFGPCQNAYTGLEETVYELTVPTDDAEVLPQALRILREFAFKIRCGADDLEKERGPVLEEWRATRNAAGRAQNALWELLMQGSRYAERMPIGLESVIRGVSAETVKGFYKRWYHPQNMAVVAVGDFEDVADVEKQIAEILGSDMAEQPEPPPRPDAPWHPHSDVHAKVLTDKEAQQAHLSVMFKCRSEPFEAPRQMLRVLGLDVLFAILNRRFEGLCRQHDAPFYAASISSEPLLSTCETHCVEVVPFEGRIGEALRGVLTELARLRLHGFSDRELHVATAHMELDLENLYLERDQEYSSDVAGEYARHFTAKELVVGSGYEARLRKTLLAKVTRAMLMDLHAAHTSANSCVLKVQAHKAGITETELRAVVAEVDSAEAKGTISPPDFAAELKSILPQEPERGTIVSGVTLPALQAREWTLGNGMRVAYRKSSFMEDEVLLSGFAIGGFSELPAPEFVSARLATLLATDFGAFGYKPHELSDLLAGKRVEVKPGEDTFWRALGGTQRPADLGAALQLVHKLFITEVEPSEAELVSFRAMAAASIAAQARDPTQRYRDFVRQLNYGSKAAVLQPLTLQALRQLDAGAACAHFSRAFRNPAEFTLCFAGAIDEKEFKDLVERYLASIPAVEAPKPIALSEVTPVAFAFPKAPKRAEVPLNMQEAVTQVQVTFPAELQRARQVRDYHWLGLLTKLLERRLTQKLRFKEGKLYSIAVSPFFELEAPSAQHYIRGDVAVSFTCAPGEGKALAEMVLQALEALQEEGPSEEEVSVALMVEQRAFEEEVQENSWWLEMLMTCYQGKMYAEHKDANMVYEARMRGRNAVREAASPDTAKEAAQRIIQHPCRKRYTLVTSTADSLSQRMVAAAKANWPVMLGTTLLAAAAATAVVLMRGRSRR